jgi:hypothetical protein
MISKDHWSLVISCKPIQMIWTAMLLRFTRIWTHTRTWVRNVPSC